MREVPISEVQTRFVMRDDNGNEQGVVVESDTFGPPVYEELNLGVQLGSDEYLRLTKARVLGTVFSLEIGGRTYPRCMVQDEGSITPGNPVEFTIALDVP